MHRILAAAALMALFGNEVAGAPQAPLAQDPRVESALDLVEIWLDAERDYRQIPGISVAVVHDQELVWSRGFGYSDIELEVAATPQTIYSICSISKLFTSVAAMQLRDEGKLRLDDPVASKLPWFDIRETYPDAPDITLRAILTHSSGLPRESDYPYWRSRDFPTREQIAGKISDQGTLYPADTYYQYSNLGLTLAGEIVSEVSGQTFAEYMKTNVLDPLKLSDTMTELPNHLLGERMATGYGPRRRDGTRKRVPPYEVRGVAPAAGFASTVEDLARFASWQFRVLAGSDSVLDRNTLREMHRVHWLDGDWETTRGLGFSVWRKRDTTFVGHGGSCPGYRSHLAIQPDDRIAVVFMANALGVNPSSYTDRVYQIVAPALIAAREEPGGAKPADPVLDPYTGMYRTDLGSETVVFGWEGKLAMLSLPSGDPLDDMIRLEHVDAATFRRIRDDGELGEEIEFVLEDGRVSSYKRHSNYYPRVSP